MQRTFLLSQTISMSMRPSANSCSVQDTRLPQHRASPSMRRSSTNEIDPGFYSVKTHFVVTFTQEAEAAQRITSQTQRLVVRVGDDELILRENSKLAQAQFVEVDRLDAREMDGFLLDASI